MQRRSRVRLPRLDLLSREMCESRPPKSRDLQRSIADDERRDVIQPHATAQEREEGHEKERVVGRRDVDWEAEDGAGGGGVLGEGGFEGEEGEEEREETGRRVQEEGGGRQQVRD